MRVLVGAAFVLMCAAQPVLAQEPAADPKPTTVKIWTAASGLSTSVLVTTGIFVPADSSFKDIYGNGPVYGGELRVALKPGGGRYVTFVDGEYRTRNGQLSYTRESTTAKVTSAEAGLLYRLSPGRISPYLGSGFGFYSYNESSAALGTAKKSGIGGVLVGGVAIGFGRNLAVDLKLKYSSCSLTPADFSLNVGGISAGFGLGVRF